MIPSRFLFKGMRSHRGMMAWAFFLAVSIAFAPPIAAQASPRPAAPKTSEAPASPKLVVVLVVDQMRGDYVDKFLGQWTGGLKRLVKEGAWFRDAAYPYAPTETCVGHATIATGAFPSTHGIIANEWWNRTAPGKEKNKRCTEWYALTPEDQAHKVTNILYAEKEDQQLEGGDSAWRLQVPSFADELLFQGSGDSRSVTFSLKARAAIMLAGHRSNAVTWFDDMRGAWETSSDYGTKSFIGSYVRAHPVSRAYGKTWSPTLNDSEYLYPRQATGAVPPKGWEASLAFPHPLRGRAAGTGPDDAFYSQWEASPYADAYLTKLAETAVDEMELGKRSGTDYLGVAYSTLDHVGHAFGPRSWEVQDILVRLDQDLGELFSHLDSKVGRQNYIVVLTADHGVVPIPEDSKAAGEDAGWVYRPEVKEVATRALVSTGFAKEGEEIIAAINGNDIYFAAGFYDRLKLNTEAMQAVIHALKEIPGVAEVYGAEELASHPGSLSPTFRAESTGYFAGRSGDLFLVPKAYWAFASWRKKDVKLTGTVHGTPYYYDQHVPVLLMGFGIQPGQYFEPITPADIAPTFAALCGITLAPRDGHVLSEVLLKPFAAQSFRAARRKLHR